MKSIGIIPARYGSSRFPGKPLARLGDRPVVQWVYAAARQVLDDVVVATDDHRIVDAVERFGGKAVLTSAQHRCGTSRVFEAYKTLHSDSEIVVNIQGDEPFVQPSHLLSLLRCFEHEGTLISTLASPFAEDATYETLADSHNVKVVVDNDSNAMYFSRSVIPYMRDCAPDQWASQTQYLRHMGVYAFRADILSDLVSLPASALERAESLEQLGWLQAGYKIRTAIVKADSIGIDTPDDLIRANNILRQTNNYIY